MLQKIIENKFKLCITVLLSIKLIYGQSRTTPAPGPLPTNSAPPEFQKVPDLSFLADPYYSCFNMKSSSVCKGYDFYIPNSGYYGDQFGKRSDSDSTSDFDKYVNEDLNENNAYVIAICPDADIKHNLRYLPYRTSVYCGRLMYSQARWCKENSMDVRTKPQLSLCKSTCLEFANSIVDYGLNICKNSDNSRAEQIKKNIIEQWCNIFSDEQGCIKGITKETENCGFTSASLFNEAIEFFPSNSCNSNSDKVQAIQDQAKEEAKKVVKMGSIRWKVVYPIAVIIIVSGATYYFWKKQNEQYKIGYIEPKEQVHYDYKVMSNVKPSRDYVDEDYIRSILESPQSTLKRVSSVNVRANENIRSGGEANNNVIYMIAIYNYHPKMKDELELKAGDRIRVEHEYNDGWGVGINENTNKFGAFPLICCTQNISSNNEALPKRNASTKLRARNSTVRQNEKSQLQNEINNDIDGNEE